MTLEKKIEIDNFLKLSYKKRLEWLEEAQSFIQDAYKKNEFLNIANKKYNEYLKNKAVK
ncbi:MAG: hypothetical protein KBA47_00275 [Caldisericia bacterium]|nr:hypothetical protein [Caldisericia bacterium]